MRRTVLGGTVLLAVAAAAAASCGTDARPELVGVCERVRCENASPFVRCDPADGICKCGDPALGLICGPGAECTPQEDTFVCVNTRCALQHCALGETCSLSTGECACGTGPDARKCDEAQTCLKGRCRPDLCDAVECKHGSSCDPDDGVCRCGGAVCDAGSSCYEGHCIEEVWCDDLECQPGEECLRGDCSCAGGPGCAQDQRCVDGACTSDPCAGVNCPFGTTCNPDDSLCHCGTDGAARGPLCIAGEACVAGRCVGLPDPCETASCGADRYCDGSSGRAVCRCAQPPDHPECPYPEACTPTGCAKRGDACVIRDCEGEVPGSSCDPEDGICKCGGLDGAVCDRAGHACVERDGERLCAQRCEPLLRFACRSPSDACVYEASRGFAVCLHPGDGLAEGCEWDECPGGTFCPEGGVRCRNLCDLSATDREPSGCADRQHCEELPGSLDPLLGQCRSSG